LIPAQPALLVIGDRQIPIDEWPMTGSVEEMRSVEVEQSGNDLFVIAQWIRQTGQALGEFLAVPVIDKLHHGA
jgi:hypothetical protein